MTNGRTLPSTLASLQRRFRGSSRPTQTTLRCRWISSSVWWRKTTLVTWPSVSALVSFPTMMCEWQAFHGIVTFEFGWCIQGWKAWVWRLIKMCVLDCFFSELNTWVYLAHLSHFPYFTRDQLFTVESPAEQGACFGLCQASLVLGFNSQLVPGVFSVDSVSLPVGINWVSGIGNWTMKPLS